jgi:hypothetical protein
MNLIDLIEIIFPPKEPVGCQDCEHFIKNRHVDGLSTCRLYTQNKLDFVSGVGVEEPMLCSRARRDNWLCGYEGRSFKPKQS